MQICHDIGFAHIDKQVVFEEDRTYSFSKNAIPNLQISDQVAISRVIISNLELSARVLLLILLLAGGNNEVIHGLNVGET